jgi:predicted  nucleic acid-binding Zn-ribbon protein
MIKKCPKCGFENEMDDITSSSECPSCGVIYAKYERFLEQQKEQQKTKQKIAEEAKKKTQQKASTPSKKQYVKKNENDSPMQQSHKSKLVNPVIVASVIVALVISFVGYKIYLKIEARNAEKEFSTFMGTVSSKMIKLAIDSESVVDEINRAWRDAIFSDDDKRDFNVAIREVRIKRTDTISSIEKLSEEIAKNFKKMNPPTTMESDYERLKELYLLFNKYANMAVAPSGSLQTYSRQNSELSVEIKSAIKELEMMK